MSSAANLYHSVINDVVSNVKDSFLDESVDENVLQELKTLWTQKLEQSKTIEPPQRPSDPIMDARRANAMGGRGGAGRGAAAAGSYGGAAQQPGGAGPGAAAGGAGAAGQQFVITDPNRLVPVQITIPAQPGNAASQPRALTVQVPAHALHQTGNTSVVLQSVLTQAITQALSLPESHAAVFLQTQINNAFKL